MPQFDAIVVGSGISGGWSAKELTERGLKVALLHRGIKVDPGEHYSDFLDPWEAPNQNRVNEELRNKEYPNVPGKTLVESNRAFWTSLADSPYDTESGTKFDWLHGDTSGGKSVTWGRRTFRLGPQDFTANLEDGHGVDWPIRYEDLEKWYEKVEVFAGISGSYENLPHLPDSVFQKPFELNCGEKKVKAGLEAAFPTRKMINTRCAHLTEPTKEQQEMGRGKCLGRNLCARGCSFGAYFSSVNATLPAAEATGNLTQIPHAIVDSVVYDDATGRVTGVKYIDEKTGKAQIVTAKIVFLNASTVGTTMIMLNSTSERFPNGLANDSGQLGLNLMDHVSPRGAITGDILGLDDKYYAGRAPAGFYIPRYANITETGSNFLRGFGFQGKAERTGWTGNRPGIGERFKVANRTPGRWRINMTAFGEVLPDAKNKMYLHPEQRDKWGIPVPVFDAKMRENELKMMQQANRDARAMLEAAGCVNIRGGEIKTVDDISIMGNRIHEMGTARMGRDPETSVLDRNNAAHSIPNLFVTDGACMTSAACQNPSLTYMALSARAAHFAADQLESGAL